MNTKLFYLNISAGIFEIILPGIKIPVRTEKVNTYVSWTCSAARMTDVLSVVHPSYS